MYLFCRVGADYDSQLSETASKASSTSSIITITSPLNEYSVKYLKGVLLVKNQIIAIGLKKVLAYLRTWHLLILQIVLPIVLLVISILNSRSYSPEIYFSPLEMSLDLYKKPITVISGLKNDYSNHYKNLVEDYEVMEVENVTTTMLQLVRDVFYVRQVLDMCSIISCLYKKNII